MFKSINDAGVYDPGLDKGATEIWFMRPGQSRDLGEGSKFLLRESIPMPSPGNLKGTHVLLGKIKEKSPHRIFALMQGENWSPNGEARNLVQRAGTDHTSMMQGDILKVGNRVLMIDQGMSFYDFEKGKKVTSSAITARPLSKIKKTMAPHMWVISRDSAGGYIVTMGDPSKSSSKIKQSFHESDAKDELLRWVKYNIGKGGKVAEDHVIDQTGLKIAPAEYTQWYVENIMSAAVTATLDDVADLLEKRGKRALAMQVDDVASDFAEFAESAKLSKNKPVEIDDITSIPEGHTFSWRGRIWDVGAGGSVKTMDGSKTTTLKEVQDTARENESKIWAKPKYLGKTPGGGIGAAVAGLSTDDVKYVTIRMVSPYSAGYIVVPFDHAHKPMAKKLKDPKSKMLLKKQWDLFDEAHDAAREVWHYAIIG